jgi:hypothetical protein
MTSSAEDFAAAQAAEYSQFVAVAAIDYGGARAFNIGDPVPASNVALHGYLDAGLVHSTSAPSVQPAVPAAEPAPQDLTAPVSPATPVA